MTSCAFLFFLPRGRAQINNVGVSYDHAEYLHEISDALVERILNVNVRALTKMTRIVLPGMVQLRMPRGPSARACPHSPAGARPPRIAARPGAHRLAERRFMARPR